MCRSDETLDVVDLLTEDGSSLATVVAFGCHPTVLAWGNSSSPPTTSPSCVRWSSVRPARPALFLQGCGADRAPAAGFSNQVADADAVGRAVGHAAVAALLESRQALLEIEPVEVRESGAALCITRASPAAATRRRRLGAGGRARSAFAAARSRRRPAPRRAGSSSASAQVTSRRLWIFSGP